MCCFANPDGICHYFIKVVKMNNAKNCCSHDSTIGWRLIAFPDSFCSSMRISHKLRVANNLEKMTTVFDHQLTAHAEFLPGDLVIHQYPRTQNLS